ncbi:Chromosome partition protein Smc [Planctomycetes bacterium Pan216]|uniref:Chromosome partition protein Smc n=1 Tax=Kolteria novifilia TaxID=2527975 RepID=A0A518AYE5_9BACT|nr:Chromosome partition protein Smc [Planctomycetes bacterium Pan216]
MSTAIETLKELHQLHIELHDAQSQLEQGPRRLKGRKADLTRREQKLGETREELKQLKLKTDRLELDLRTGEDKRDQLKGRINQVKSNVEYNAVQEEIKSRNAANGELEEAILEAFTEQEEIGERIIALEKEFADAEADFAQFKEKTEYTLEKMTGRVGVLEEKIDETTRKLTAENLGLYKKLLKSRGGKDALAPCRDQTCQSCYTQLTAQSWNDLLMDRAVVCKSCGSLLYRD